MPPAKALDAISHGGQRDRYEPIVLTAAITGGDVLPSQSDAIPCGADEIIREGVAAAAAGAACVHIHGREADGRPSGDAALLAEIAGGIRAASDVTLSLSTGGAPGMTLEERLGGLEAVAPEFATLNLGTMNYEGFPTPARWPRVERDWEREVLARSGNVVFENTLDQIRTVAARCQDLGVVPELEAYDIGHLTMARFLVDEGTLNSPVRVQLVLGVLGGADNSLETLFELVGAARRILGSDLGSLGVAAVGYPMQFRHCAAALGLGLDCRVGLEDSIRIARSENAGSNADLVSVVVGLAAALGRPLASPVEVRGRLGVGGPDD